MRLETGPYENCIDLRRHQITCKIGNWNLGDVYRQVEVRSTVRLVIGLYENCKD